MNSLHLSPPSLLAPKRLGHRALWLASAAWVIGSIAGATVAMANVPVGQWSSDLPASAAVTSPQAPLESEAPAAQVKSGCNCGVVEIIRKLEAAGTTPAAYEFTVRMRDGSTRVSSNASVAKWRVGDSIMLIGGDRSPAKALSSKAPVSL